MIRSGAVIFSAPVFGSRNVPALLKAGTTFLVALVLLPLIQIPATSLATDYFHLGLYVLKESFIGLMIGFATLLFMNSFFIAGQVIDTQMGLGITNVIDPLSRTSIPIIGQVQFLIATLIFLAINGPYHLIHALLWSYQVLPLADLRFPDAFGSGLLRISADMWVIALKVGAPAIGTLLLTMIGLGMVAKTVPQMNIFIVGFPVTIGVGLLSVYVSLFWFRPLVKKLFALLFEQIGFLLSSGGL